MTGVDDLVLPDEAVTWAGRPRLLSALPAVVVGIALAAGGVVASLLADRPVALIAVPLGVSIAVWGYLVVINTRFVVTGSAVYRKTGVLSRTVRRVGIERVQNSGFSQGVRGVLFGYGTVTIQAAGGGGLVFHDVEDPRDVRALVDRRIGVAGEIPGTAAEWEAVLAEVRAWRSAVEGTTDGR